MRKSLLLLAMCLTSLGTYAQDDDVYFVPSSEDEAEARDTYTAPGHSSYAPIPQSPNDTYAPSDWATGRGNCGRDVDEYNRRGRNYNHNVQADTLTAQGLYDQGYNDGYEDGSCTARIVRFCSPRAGIYVSSPYYLDYYDLYCYDPWYYGYGWPYYASWSGWYGWGSWYGWRPWYSSWYWGWGGWYDPWYGGPFYGHGWGGWHPNHWIPQNAERGPRGGWVAYGGRRGSGAATYAGSRSSYSNRPSRAFGFANGRGVGTRSSFGNSGSNRPSRSFGNASRSSQSYGNNRPSTRSSEQSSYPSRSFGNSGSRSGFSSPSRSSSFGSGSSFSGGSRSGFGGGGGRSFGGGGGSRGGGGRR